MAIPPPRAPINRDEVLRLRREEHLPATEIARRLGYSPGTVRAVLARLGESLRPMRRVSDARWGERLRSLFTSLRQRCSNPGNPLYPRYGARGVRMCAEWKDFWTFYDWAIASGYRPRLQLEIVGRSKRFSPKTCRWITARQRMQSVGPRPTAARTVEAFGESKTASEWAHDERCVVSLEALRSRLRKGVPPEPAMTLPPHSVLPKDGRRARKSKAPPKRLDWDEIVRLHVREGLGPTAIAARVGAVRSTIRRGLEARGERRRREELPHAARLRDAWQSVRRHCTDESHPAYRYYGARGARLCDEWEDFHAFHRWALENGYEPGLWLTRREGTRIFSPRNCDWVPPSELSRTAPPDGSQPPRWTVEAFGERKGPAEWARDSRCTMSLTGLIYRLRAGWSPEDAITTPPTHKARENLPERPVEAFGTTKGIAAWCRDRRCKVKPATLKQRLDRGIPPEEAIRTPPYELE